MAATPPNHRELLDKLATLMQEWDRLGYVGELALIRGKNQWEIEKRPRFKAGSAKHEQRGGSTIEVVERV